MRQLALVLLAALLAAATAEDVPAAELAAPCSDDGLAHIPEVPEGARRPYSVRKRSRTEHREPAAGADLPPGQRRFDAVLPDEEGHDVPAKSPGRGRGQRRLGHRAAEEVNEVAGSVKQEAQRRTARRPAARPRKTVAETEENYPPSGEHDAKSDAIVDSYEKVQRYPSHLPTDDDNSVATNDVALDQVALEDVPTGYSASDNAVLGDGADLETTPRYRSKFPERVFSSDVGGSGDVLRVKPRKHVNQFQPQLLSQGGPESTSEAATPRTVQAPRHGPRQRPEQPEAAVSEEAAAAASATPGASGTPPGPSPRGRQRQAYRTSHRVQGAPDAARGQRRHPLREPNETPSSDDDSSQEARRRPRPRPAEPVEAPEALPADSLRGGDGQPQRRPQRRRPVPRPKAVHDEDEDVPSATQQPPRRPARRRPSVQPQPQTHVPGSERGHGRRLNANSSVRNLPQVEVVHDGTDLADKPSGHEPSLVRTAIKKVPSGSLGGDPSPELIQKIVKNTLRRLKPQIAEHDGDVGVDILVKIIQVED